MNIRLLFGMVLFSVALMVVSCDPEEDFEGTVELNFKSTYLSEPLQMYERDYNYEDNLPIKFQLFNFYISDITLVQEDAPIDPALQLSEVELVTFQNTISTEEAEQGLTFTYDKIPVGVYSGIQLGIGIAPDLNATQPGNYAPGHPLDDNYWSWARGYVFSKIEGNTDLDGDGQFNDKLTYHMGADDLYQVVTYTFPTPLNLNSDEPLQLSFNVDMHEVLVNDGQYLDFNVMEQTQDHNNNPDIYQFLWDNLVDAIEIQQ